MREATTGTPAAIASAAARPNVSAARDGTIASAARARRSASSWSLTRAVKRTSAAARAGEALLGRGPRHGPEPRPPPGDEERQAGLRAGRRRHLDALLDRDP